MLRSMVCEMFDRVLIPAGMAALTGLKTFALRALMNPVNGWEWTTRRLSPLHGSWRTVSAIHGTASTELHHSKQTTHSY